MINTNTEFSNTELQNLADSIVKCCILSSVVNLRPLGRSIMRNYTQNELFRWTGENVDTSSYITNAIEKNILEQSNSQYISVRVAIECNLID